jgi:hypothetical protein
MAAKSQWPMECMICKTTFLQFQMCAKDTWLELHKPELFNQFKPTQFELHLMEQGSEVEAGARRLFPDGRLMTATSVRHASRRDG